MSTSAPGVPSGVELVRAANPSPMTLDGTNTWVVTTGEGNVVIDPGPELPEHLNAVAALGSVACALLTHRHSDHSAGAHAFHQLTGAPVRARDAGLCVGGAPLPGDNAVMAFGDVEIRVHDTPGHTSDSVCFTVQAGEKRHLFSGDTVLGSGTTIVAHPDGVLADYLDSLARLHELTLGMRWVLLPGHGPIRDNAHQVIGEYIAHRRERLEQVRAAMSAGAGTAHEVVQVVYADVDRSLWPAAEATVRAQLAYLTRDSGFNGQSA